MSQAMNEENGMKPVLDDDFSLDFTGDEGDATGEQTQEEAKPTSEHQAEDVQTQEQLQEQPQEQEQPQLSDIDSLKQQLNEAMGIINAYKQKELEQVQSIQQAKQPTEAQPPVDATLKQTTPGEVAKLDFLQGQDHIEILKDPVKFNELLSRVATVSFNAAVNAAQEQVMLKIPDIVRSSASQQLSLANTVSDFYAKNQDLIPFKQAVSMMAMQVYNENPKLSLPELLGQAAIKTRDVLRLSKAAPQGTRTPAQPAGGSVRSAGGNRTSGGQPEMSDQERQIADLLAF